MYADQEKTRSQDKLYILDQFVRTIVWWKFNSTPFVWRNVYAKVSSLLGDAPDLLAEFSKFKPQLKKQVEEASGDGKFPPPVYIDHIVELSKDNPCGENMDSQILVQNTAEQDQKYTKF